MGIGKERSGTLHDALQGLSFPVTSKDVLEHASSRGVETLEWGHHRMSLRVVFDRLDGRTFMSEADVAAAVSAVEEAQANEG